MSKTSDWKIVATEGSTVDGRKITASWIKDMAELYSTSEYTAMVWPEHYRSSWAPFEGKNWGVVEELKSGKMDDKLRLFAKITPNKYLLDSNKDGQKLFTSIEPNPDYKGEGRCYLEGLAVTDSPASTGTTRLTFSRNNQDTDIECSDLEELNFSECFSRSDRFFSLCKDFFGSEENNSEQPINPEDTDVTKEELTAALKEQFSALKGELKTELSAELATKFSVNKPDSQEQSEGKNEGATVEQFSAALDEKLNPLMEKVTGLETKFAELSQEVPGQEPGAEGASSEMEVW